MGRAREAVPFMLFDEGKSEEEIVAFLEKYALLSPDRGRKVIQFDREWGAYSFNYTVGRGILRRYLAAARISAFISRPTGNIHLASFTLNAQYRFSISI
jgi:hypothetical protein